MTSRRELVEGIFVTARIGAHRIAVEAASVAEVLPCGEGRAAVADLGHPWAPGTVRLRRWIDLESVLGLERPPSGDRLRLRLRRARGGAELEVPGPDLQVGRRLRGRCHSPTLVAAALERCCLAGVIQDDERLFYVLDVARFFTRYVEPEFAKGDSS
jgi:hypothetical protein